MEHLDIHQSEMNDLQLEKLKLERALEEQRFNRDAAEARAHIIKETIQKTIREEICDSYQGRNQQGMSIAKTRSGTKRSLQRKL